MPKLLCLLGPTATGKTDLACLIQDRLPIEIISVDSAMVYREMDIGTAKPSRDLLKQYPHHLLDIINPDASYSAASFCEQIALLVESIQSRGKWPLLVGGTMMYFRALQQGLAVLPQANPEIRQAILVQANEFGWPKLHEKLAEVDPHIAAKIHPHDAQRIQRGLEVFAIAGKPMSTYLDVPLENGFDCENVILFPEDRAWLHQRIAERFQLMLSQGFVEEVKALVDKWHLSTDSVSMRSVGYRQVLEYLQNNEDLTVLIDKGVAATRQLAKRQLTWLRHWPVAEYVEPNQSHVLEKIVAHFAQIIDNDCLR